MAFANSFSFAERITSQPAMARPAFFCVLVSILALSSALRQSEVERAKGLYEQHKPQIEQSARTLDPRQILSMVRGA